VLFAASSYWDCLRTRSAWAADKLALKLSQLILRQVSFSENHHGGVFCRFLQLFLGPSKPFFLRVFQLMAQPLLGLLGGLPSRLCVCAIYSVASVCRRPREAVDRAIAQYFDESR